MRRKYQISTLRPERVKNLFQTDKTNKTERVVICYAVSRVSKREKREKERVRTERKRECT
jgi:hypothetical protein